MRQETNNEMDLLLRRLGRRDDASASDVAGYHLDADELNAYAENALPAAARARYTAHLADCVRCREFVVQLSASAGVVSAAQTTTVSKPWVLKTFLASLFTPMVLRYAAPALGLIVVAAIAFIVLRRDQPGDYVTQVTNNEQGRTAPAVAESPQTVVDSPIKNAPSSEGVVEKQANKRDETASGPASPNAAAPVTTQTETSKDAVSQAKPEQQPAAANEAPPPPKAAATAEESPRTTDTEVTKKEVRGLPAAPVSAEKALRAEQREDRRSENFTRDGDNKNKQADRITTAGAGSIARVQRERLYDENAETRSVAGRRFRKQDGIWVDTAYNSSSDTTTLTRGSEQYRALVADEPEIKNIADTLGGEIIVVWKGRAYRIR